MRDIHELIVYNKMSKMHLENKWVNFNFIYILINFLFYFTFKKYRQFETNTHITKTYMKLYWEEMLFSEQNGTEWMNT